MTRSPPRWPTRSQPSRASPRTEPLLQRYAQLVDKEGAAITTGGAPTLGVAWTGDSSLSGLEIKGEGAPPVGPDQVAIDKATADREDFVVGDTITVLTDTGSNDFTITALVGLGDTDGFAGATLAAWDVSTAADVLDAGDSLDGVDVAVAEGADVATVQSRIEEILPPGTEVITRDVLVEENKADLDVFIDAFQTGLLIFAFITAFVSAFLINNVFQITIGQRLRELALLRAVGASGTQVRRMIYVEALVMSVIATAIGIGGGVLVAKLMLSLFNSAGLGFPDAGTVLMPRSVVHGGRRRCRHHAAVGDRAGPPRSEDPTGRHDASRARVRGAQHTALGRRYHGRCARCGDVRPRALPAAGRRARADRACRCSARS